MNLYDDGGSLVGTTPFELKNLQLGQHTIYLRANYDGRDYEKELILKSELSGQNQKRDVSLMVPVIANRGASFARAFAYYLHDKNAQTSERVAWTRCLNLMTDCVEGSVQKVSHFRLR